MRRIGKKKIKGSRDFPRLVVFKSNRFFYAQIIDDMANKVLAASDSRLFMKKCKDKDLIKKMANDLIEKVADKKIKRVKFDRGKWPYRGNIKKLFEEIQEGL